MSLQPGTRLGPYEITNPLGQGGMGEVYQARDTTLNRDVAIKVLPAALADDPDRLARFQREAESLAALNHPNIAHIHGLEKSGHTPAIVMELVPGPTLADRIKAGPMPFDEALPIARQIADALDAAHARGIVHRDLKPANIKVKDDGTVKVLDFGLAKALDPVGGDGAAGADSPTITSPALTQMGLILGTAAYMSPEQAKGKAVDTRADVWAFGCVLYEMLSGRQAWAGETVTDVIAALVAREPDWSRLPPTLPPRLRFLLERCLDKDVNTRTQNIGEVRAELERATSDPVGVSPAFGRTAGPVGWRSRLAWPLVTVAVAAAVAAAVWVSMRPAPKSPVWLAALHPGPEVPGGNHFNANVAMSHDGTRLAYTTTTSAVNQNVMPLYVREMDEPEPRVLAQDARAPFFSPDGEWVGFVKGNGPLMKVAFAGGPAVRIGGDANANRGMSWGPDGTIVFATSDPARGLSRISDAGDGEEQALTTPDTSRGEVNHLFPEFLPGGATLLFTIAYANGDFRIAALDLDSGTYDTLIPGGSDAHYASSGHIVYGVDGTLRAVSFDPDRLAVHGTPVPVADGVVTWLSGAASFAIADDGTLVYISGEAENAGSATARTALVALDRDGGTRPISGEYRAYGGPPRVSPDGRRIAVTVTEGTRGGDATHIWIVDASSGLGTQLTFAGTRNRYPVWSADGRSVFFVSDRDTDAPNSIYRQAADFSREATLVYRGNTRLLELRDVLRGQHLVIVEGDNRTDIRLLDLESGTTSDFVATPADEFDPRVSPDGHWIAYASEESGRQEVYVRPAPPAAGAQRRVSDEGGAFPMWSPKGDELFFYSLENDFMAVPVQLEPSFTAGRVQRLFTPGQRISGVAPDGAFIALQRELTNDGDASRPSSHLIVVQHWFADLKRKVPGR